MLSEPGAGGTANGVGAPWAAKRLTRAGAGGAAGNELGASAGAGGAAGSELGASAGAGGAAGNELGARARGAPRAPTKLESAGGGGGSGMANLLSEGPAALGRAKCTERVKAAVMPSSK